MPEGNGKPPEAHVTIAFERPRPDWVIIHVQEATIGMDISLHLHRALTDWLANNPGVRVRNVLPIVSNGQTVCLHVWHDGQETPGSPRPAGR
jgi:hypothetical protein